MGALLRRVLVTSASTKADQQQRPINWARLASHLFVLGECHIRHQLTEPRTTTAAMATKSSGHCMRRVISASHACIGVGMILRGIAETGDSSIRICCGAN